ncbi:MAG: TetR/AcrR family transcriptional regulator [Solirubrobacteraceae bacterium]|nr:TetR/AcrR family transcriptional regulator [Solirubrobacteraceae bacterium]
MESSTPPPRKKDGRRERTAKAISDAASALFFDQGVARTTIDEIAETAGVSVGSVYVHFGSKEALYLALVEDAAAVNAQYVAEAQPSDSPLERVFNAGEAYVRFAMEQPIQFRLISMQVNQQNSSPELEAARQRITERVEGRLTAIGLDLALAMEAGEIDHLPVETAVKFLWATWTAVISLTLRTDRLRISPEEMRATLQIASNVLSRGLGRPIGASELFADLDPAAVADRPAQDDD